MIKPATTARVDPDAIPRMPGWISLAPTQTLADAAFWSGAMLSHMHLVAASEDLPLSLWRERLALNAAEACVGFSGRQERAAELRDAVHLARPGDHPGSAGEIFRQWSRVVARPMSVAALGRGLPGLTPDQIAAWLEPGQGNPVARTAKVLEAVLADRPRAETAALILADAVLARALGWDHLLPVLAVGLRPRDLRKRGDELLLACHRAVVAGAGQAVPLAIDLSRRVARLRSVVPLLRAKAAANAVDLFLSRDALAPAAIAAFMSDRAARRLCDRLVALGAVRELTGRDSFRLYGV